MTDDIAGRALIVHQTAGQLVGVQALLRDAGAKTQSLFLQLSYLVDSALDSLKYDSNASLPPFGPKQIRRILAARAARDTILAEVFRDPVWDMMLHLYAAELDGREVTRRELSALVEDVSEKTAERWINAMIDRDVFVRSIGDERRAYIRLHPLYATRLEAYLNDYRHHAL